MAFNRLKKRLANSANGLPAMSYGQSTIVNPKATQPTRRSLTGTVPTTSWTSLTDPVSYAQNHPGWTNPGGRDPLGNWDAYAATQPNLQKTDPYAPPPRGSIVETYGALKNSGLIPEFKPIDFKPIEGLDASKYGTLSGFGDDYYNNLTDQATKRMQEQYFTRDNSLSNQLKNQMNKRGLIGSGIEAGATTDLYKDFGSELSDFQSQLATQKAQQDLDIANKNREFAYGIDTANMDINKFNTTGAYEAAAKDRDAQNLLAQLGLSAAGDELRASTDYGTKIFDSMQKARQAEVDKQNNIITQLNQALTNENIDPKERAYYRDLLSSYLGSTDLFSGLTKSEWDRRMGEQQGSALGSGGASGIPSSAPQAPGTYPGQIQYDSYGNAYQWSGSAPNRPGSGWVPLNK